MGVNSDQLLQRWVPVGPVSEGVVPSYHAKGPDGQFVQVHRIPRDATDFGRLFSLVQRVLPQPPQDLVEVGEFEGGVAVVTRILPGPVTLEDWLQESVARFEPVSPPPTTEPEVSEPEVSEPAADDSYTAYFRIPPEGETAPEPKQTHDPPGADELPPPAAAPAQAPSAPLVEEGYTALFAAPVRPQKAPPGPLAEPPPPAPTGPPPTVPRAAPPEPPSAAPPPRPAPAAQPPTETESITDMFRKPAAPPPGRPDPHRPQRWDEPERGLSPLQITLDEYIRRLERS